LNKGEWDEVSGWTEKMPESLFTRGGSKEVKLWDFNGADMDQGLFTHLFVINRGGGLLIDTSLKTIKQFDKGLLHEPARMVAYPGPLSVCSGRAQLPTDMFAHFTGNKKPWMNPLENLPQSSFMLRKWAKHLDELQLDINSKNIGSLGLGSPLGFWNTKLKVAKKINDSS
jgi:hypothetical protein